MTKPFTFLEALEVVRFRLIKVDKVLTAPDAEIASQPVLDAGGKPIHDLKDRRVRLAQAALDEAGNDLVAVMYAARFVADLRTKIKVDEKGITVP